MIVQPREPAPGSMLEHAADADARRHEPWVTDLALQLDAHGLVRVDYPTADRLRAERQSAEQEPA